VWLSSTECDDAPYGIVRRDTDRHAIAGHYFDPEAAHPAAQLRKHLVARVTLDAIQPTRVDRNNRSLHIY
jgi:hypothetical protein